MSTTVFLLLLGAVNLFSFLLYGIDKRRAIQGDWRIPESSLLLAAVCGGSAGALLGMYLFRHKTHKFKFRLIVPTVLLIQMAVTIYIMYILLSRS